MQSEIANQANMSRAALQDNPPTQPNLSRAALQAARSGGFGARNGHQILHYRRFQGYDYNRGASIFVTFAIAGRRPVFGRVEGDKVALSAAGQAAEASIAAENRRSGAAVRCVSSVVMPDHVHMRLVLAPTNDPEPLRHVGQFVANIKRWTRVHAAKAGISFEWEPNYHDHICVSRFINEKVDAYIGYNPLKWALMHGAGAPLKVHEPLISPRFPGDEWWTAAGNTDLLAQERKIAAISISRSLRPEDLPAVTERLLAAARAGWVVASTFISPGEIAVRRALEAEKLPCIVAKPDPLKMIYRPHVEETATFAEGRLVVISRECSPEISRYDAWHGIGEALSAMAAASGGGAGAYVHRKGGLAAPRWEFRGQAADAAWKCGLKGHTYQVENTQHEQGGPSGRPVSCSSQHKQGGPSGRPVSRPSQLEQGGPSGRPVSRPSQLEQGGPSGRPVSRPSQHEQGGPSGRPESGEKTMNIDKKLENGRLAIALAGRLDTNTSPDLESELKLDGVTEIAFDFANLEYISSAGLRVLMTAQKTMMASGGKMAILHPNDMVKGVFDMTGLSSVFTVVP